MPLAIHPAFGPILAALTLAACSPPKDAAPAPVERPPEKAQPDSAAEARAIAARKVVLQYFERVEKADYAAALQLWSQSGQDGLRGDPKQLAARYTPYTRFHGVPAPVEAAYSGADPNYIVVPATAEVTLHRDGTDRTLEGLVYLHRAPGGDGATWRIDGVDIRKPKTEARR